LNTDFILAFLRRRRRRVGGAGSDEGRPGSCSHARCGELNAVPLLPSVYRSGRLG
jgi:hypothetical protein